MYVYKFNLFYRISSSFAITLAIFSPTPIQSSLHSIINISPHTRRTLERILLLLNMPHNLPSHIPILESLPEISHIKRQLSGATPFPWQLARLQSRGGAFHCSNNTLLHPIAHGPLLRLHHMAHSRHPPLSSGRRTKGCLNHPSSTLVLSNFLVQYRCSNNDILPQILAVA